ncbi:MAG: hypothetical protein RLY19_505 [Actinomycetota bacterium]
MSDNKPLKHKYGTIDNDYGMFLATRPPEEDGPIYMVNLMKYHEVAQYTEGEGNPGISGKEADDRYNPSSVLNKIGANVVFYGDVVSNNVGTEDWDRIGIVRYATRKSFIEMQSRSDFSEKHVHKAAGMERTTLVCCRPEDESIDTRDRPTPLELRTVAMVVRRNVDVATAYTAIPGAVNFAGEGTIIGDGRKWDTVQFVPVSSVAEVETIAQFVKDSAEGDCYVMGVHVTLDCLTTP